MAPDDSRQHSAPLYDLKRREKRSDAQPIPFTGVPKCQHLRIGMKGSVYELASLYAIQYVVPGVSRCATGSC